MTNTWQVIRHLNIFELSTHIHLCSNVITGSLMCFHWSCTVSLSHLKNGRELVDLDVGRGRFSWQCLVRHQHCTGMAVGRTVLDTHSTDSILILATDSWIPLRNGMSRRHLKVSFGPPLDTNSWPANSYCPRRD